MEIRLTASGQNSLSTKVCFSDENGFEVASTIVMGKKDAILIDAQWTLSNAHRVITEILDTGKNLTTIYLSHAHPDHYFGAGVIAQAFPKARVVAIPSEADIMNKQFFGKIEHWEGIIGSHNVCRVSAKIESLKENHLELEGQPLEIMTKVMGDMRYNTMVWIPSIKTLVASDVLFNQAHPFTCELTKEERAQWIADVDKIEKMGAEVIIPGHQKPGMPVRQELSRFHQGIHRRHRRRAGKTGHRCRLLLRHGGPLPAGQSRPPQQRNECDGIQGRPGLELARNIISIF